MKEMGYSISGSDLDVCEAEAMLLIGQQVAELQQREMERRNKKGR